MTKCWVLVRYNEQGNVIGLFSPDLKKDLFSEFSGSDDMDFRRFLKKRLNNQFEKSSKEKLKKYADIKDIDLTSKEHWECIEIQQTNKISFLGKAFPITGYVFSVFAILSNAFIAYMALRITSSTNEKDSASSIVFSICATLFRSLVNFFIYIMSDSSKTLQDFGERVSNWRTKNEGTLEPAGVAKKTRSCLSSTALILTSIGAGTAVLANVTINTIILFQESLGLTDRYLNLYPNLSDSERESYYELIKWIVVVAGTLAGNYCELAFETTFALQLIDKLKEKLNLRQIKNSTNIEAEINATRSTVESELVPLIDSESSEQSHMKLV